MNLTIISVGNKPNKWEFEGINHYIKQFKNNVKIDFINIKGQQNPKRSTAEVLKLEADLITQKIPSDSYLILCDMAGEKLSSMGLSKLFEKLTHKNLKICFVIGGSFGLSENLNG